MARLNNIRERVHQPLLGLGEYTRFGDRDTRPMHGDDCTDILNGLYYEPTFVDGLYDEPIFAHGDDIDF